MALLIDPPRWPAHGRLWSHLVSDTSLAELHEFAERLGIPRRGFEGDHYDIPEERYAAAVAAGARESDIREVVHALQRSGLRRQKRRLEGVVESTADAPWLPPGGRADVVASRQDDPPAGTVVVRLAVRRPGALLVVDRPGRGLDLPHRVLGGRSVELSLGELERGLLGAPRPGARLRGYVRNTVSRPTPDYPWPAPRACFAVYELVVDAEDVTRRGRWVEADEAAEVLADRHWWPLYRGSLG